ncbi:hypothetical protein EB118_07265 [bacterium]|nr:hypothetical protein [bacterium]
MLNVVLAYQAYFKLKDYLSIADTTLGVDRLVLFEANEGIPKLFAELVNYYRHRDLPFTHVPVFEKGYSVVRQITSYEHDNIKITKLFDFIFIEIRKLCKQFAVAIQTAKQKSEDNSVSRLANLSIETKVVQEIDVILFVFLQSIGIIRGTGVSMCASVLDISSDRLEFVLQKCNGNIMKGYSVCDFCKRKDDPDGELCDVEYDDKLRRKLSFVRKNESITGKVTSFFTNYMKTDEPYALRILVGIAFYITKTANRGGTIGRAKTIKIN